MRFLPASTTLLVLAFLAHAEIPEQSMPDTPPLTATNLRCEYLRDPLGIDVERPRLSWEISDPTGMRRGARQSAYRILVASSPERLAMDVADVWDSCPSISPSPTSAPTAAAARPGHTGLVESRRLGRERRQGPTAASPRGPPGPAPAKTGASPVDRRTPQDPPRRYGPNPPIPPATMLRRVFSAPHRIRRATPTPPPLRLHPPPQR